MIKRSLLAIFFVACAFVIASLPKSEGVRVEAKRKTAQPQLTAQQVAKDPAGTIDGKRNPELIPDTAAYTALFLTLANRNSPQEQESARAYLTRFDPGLSDSDIASLISVANEYRRRVSVFDAQVKVIKDLNWPKPDSAVFVKLGQLQTAKEALIHEIASSLRSKLSPRGTKLLTDQLLPHIKSNTKLAPEPRSLPGGEDWQPQTIHH